MRRRLFSILSALSLMLFAAVLVWRVGDKGYAVTATSTASMSEDGGPMTVIGTSSDVFIVHDVPLGRFRLRFPLAILLTLICPVFWAISKAIRWTTSFRGRQ